MAAAHDKLTFTSQPDRPLKAPPRAPRFASEFFRPRDLANIEHQTVQESPNAAISSCSCSSRWLLAEPVAGLAALWR